MRGITSPYQHSLIISVAQVQIMPCDYPEVGARSFAALRMTAICHPERSEGSLVRIRPADPTHVALGLVGNHLFVPLALCREQAYDGTGMNINIVLWRFI
jgi:hypothetical protein